ncbi:MAG TPA: hypothetical protein VLM76_07205 [Patescibacteria group bacterium]|nr:hypothetical protein [Patescibacteria group bacterium]
MGQQVGLGVREQVGDRGEPRAQALEHRIDLYRCVPPRPLEEIDAEISALEEEIQRLLREVTA